jgi:RNA polymerase sigma-70 factor, ECF subfamily
MMNEFQRSANAAGERLRCGAHGSLEEVIDLYQKKIYNLAYRFLCDKDEAFDLSQEIFLRVYAKIDRFSPGTDFNAWFMRLAVNTAINYLAKSKRSPAREAAEFDDLSGAFHNEQRNKDHIQHQSLNCEVEALLGQLPRKERMVITLQLWEKMKVKEIALVTGGSVKSVESLLTRARKRLKKIIEKTRDCEKESVL